MEIVNITCGPNDTRETIREQLKGKVPEDIIEEALADYDKFKSKKNNETKKEEIIDECLSDIL
jgi:hypothetical protein